MEIKTEIKDGKTYVWAEYTEEEKAQKKARYEARKAEIEARRKAKSSK